MKITLDVSLSSTRIRALLRDGTVVFDEVAVVALKPKGNGENDVVGIGSDRIDLEGTTLVPVVSQIQFDPDLAAVVVGYVTLKVWNDMRPGWRQVQMLLDRMDAWIAVEGYERLTKEDQRRFTKALRPFPRLTWWVAGEKVRY